MSLNPELVSEIIREHGGTGSKKEQAIRLVHWVRDIPYGVTGSRSADDVYKLNMGTCSGKHALLKQLLEGLGYEVKTGIVLHRFKNLPVSFPGHLKQLLDSADILDPHNYLLVKIGSKFVRVDVTWDSSLKRHGFPVNDWDGEGQMPFCTVPVRDFGAVDDPEKVKEAELAKLPAIAQEKRKEFLKSLSEWLKTQR